MPRKPNPDCPLCSGSGVMLDPELTNLSGPNRAPVDPVICMCSVSLEDIAAADGAQLQALRDRTTAARAALAQPAPARKVGGFWRRR